MTDENRKTVSIPYEAFKEYLKDDDKTFRQYVEEGDFGEVIEIEYWYFDTETRSYIGLKWKIPDTKTVYKIQYTGSSYFALWWCQVDDGEEEEE